MFHVVRMTEEGRARPMRSPKADDPHRHEKNYGVDISARIRMIENGER